MSFKVVSTIERKGVAFSAIPSSWEAEGILFWPDLSSHKVLEKLRANPESVPGLSWTKSKCCLKVQNVQTFKEALDLERALAECSDTEAEERIFDAPKKKKDTAQLFDRNYLFEEDHGHKKNNTTQEKPPAEFIHKVFGAQKKKKLMSQFVDRDCLFPIDNKNNQTTQKEPITAAECSQNSADLFLQNLFTRKASQEEVSNSHKNKTTVISESVTSEHDNIIDDPLPAGVEPQVIITSDTELFVGDSFETSFNKFKEELTALINEKFEKISKDYKKINQALDIIHANTSTQASTSKTPEPVVMEPTVEKQNFLEECPFPLKDEQEILQLEKQLDSPANKNELVQYLSKYFGKNGEGDGIKIGYKIIDIVFNREILTNYTWTGVSRTKNQNKKAFQVFNNILDVFQEVLTYADQRFTRQKTITFFKDGVLKHSKKRCQGKRLTKIQNNASNQDDHSNPEDQESNDDSDTDNVSHS